MMLRGAAAAALMLALAAGSARAEDTVGASPPPCVLADGEAYLYRAPGQPAPWCGLLVDARAVRKLAAYAAIVAGASEAPRVVTREGPTWPAVALYVVTGILAGGAVGLGIGYAAGRR